MNPGLIQLCAEEKELSWIDPERAIRVEGYSVPVPAA
jgi:hypothetical protein